jgi:hypothetical protein
MTSPLPASWHQRDLYFGTEGAKGWLATVGEQSYAPPVHELELRRLQIAAIEPIKVRTIVSLGPGDAEVDKQIAINLRNREARLEYIPVDISDGLLHHAFKVLSGQVHVPVGILGDFEDHLNFVATQIGAHGVRPFLFTLLGNTLGNLDRYERNFLDTIETVMRAGDYLLLDVSLAGPQWTRDLDRRSNHASYGPGHRRFIATGISRRSGDSIESVVLDFEHRIRFDDGASDVRNTRRIGRVDTRSGRLISAIRRYDWSSFLSWVEDRRQFEILFREPLFTDQVVGDGVVLLTKK